MKANKDQEFKADAGKTAPDLLTFGMARALRLVQATTDYGREKYTEDSWREVDDAVARYSRAAERHRQERAIGNTRGTELVLELVDEESGLPHIAHEVFNLLAIMELELCDHPSPEKLLKLLCQYNKPPVASIPVKAHTGRITWTADGKHPGMMTRTPPGPYTTKGVFKDMFEKKGHSGLSGVVYPGED